MFYLIILILSFLVNLLLIWINKILLDENNDLLEMLYQEAEVYEMKSTDKPVKNGTPKKHYKCCGSPITNPQEASSPKMERALDSFNETMESSAKEMLKTISKTFKGKYKMVSITYPAGTVHQSKLDISGKSRQSKEQDITGIKEYLQAESINKINVEK